MKSGGEKKKQQQHVFVRLYGCLIKDTGNNKRRYVGVVVVVGVVVSVLTGQSTFTLHCAQVFFR